jgi:hypothetical protein
MCSGMGIEYRGKWKSENGKWTSGTAMLGSLVTGSAMFAPRQHGGRRRIALKILILPLALACCAISICGWSNRSKPNDPLERFARACGVPSAIQQSPRIFASPDETSWHEYQSIKQIPAWPSEWTETASVWSRAGSPVLVRVVGVGHDFSDYSYYCFDHQGILIRMERQFRTVWRWGFAETILYDKKGNEEERTSSYFDTRDEHTIEPPQESDLVTPAKIFRNVTSLPFSALLSAKDRHP